MLVFNVVLLSKLLKIYARKESSRLAQTRVCAFLWCSQTTFNYKRLHCSMVLSKRVAAMQQNEMTFLQILQTIARVQTTAMPRPYPSTNEA
jgi:hypothetical protein